MKGVNEEIQVEESDSAMPRDRTLYKSGSISSVDENNSYNQYEKHIIIPEDIDQTHENIENLHQFSSNSIRDDSDDELPYPSYVPISLYCLDQTSAPRSWCLKMISNPYPFHLVNSGMS
jgi:hypothetical protein